MKCSAACFLHRRGVAGIGFDANFQQAANHFNARLPLNELHSGRSATIRFVAGVMTSYGIFKGPRSTGCATEGNGDPATAVSEPVPESMVKP